MALKNKALAGMAMEDDALEIVSGGGGLPEDDQRQDGELKCPHCPATFRYQIRTRGPRIDEREKENAEAMLARHVIEFHRIFQH